MESIVIGKSEIRLSRLVYDCMRPAGESALGAVPARREERMQARRDIKREYKERERVAGVFQIKNKANGKVLLGSSLNIDGPLNAHRFMLSTGAHRNRALQEDWNEFGADRFVFEILESVEVRDDPGFRVEDELSLLEEIWIEKLRPFDEAGYNRGSKIRQA
ncbi:MAG: GIY-YIG nuclease family protein [Candidatus Eisenbacteria bacterium]